jgi:hypothetical protein
MKQFRIAGQFQLASMKEILCDSLSRPYRLSMADKCHRLETSGQSIMNEAVRV